MTNTAPIKFALGQVIITQAARRATTIQQQTAMLERHARGDWGVIEARLKQANDEALTCGKHLFSAYAIDPAKPCPGFSVNVLWIITEPDRTATLILLPGEY